MKKLSMLLILFMFISSLNAVLGADAGVAWDTTIVWGLDTNIATSNPYAMVFYEVDTDDYPDPSNPKVWADIAPNNPRFWIASTAGGNEAESGMLGKTTFDNTQETYFMGVTDALFPSPDTQPQPNYYWAFIYWENGQNNVVTADNYLEIWFFQYSATPALDITNFENNVVTFTVKVTDINGNPIQGAEVYMNINTDTYITSEVKALMEVAMKDLLETQIANYNKTKGVYWLTDANGEVTFKVPIYVYYAVAGQGYSWSFNLTAKYNGYTSNTVTVSTANGNQIISLQFPTQLVQTTYDWYISFWRDEAMTQPFSLYGYTINVTGYTDATTAFDPNTAGTPIINYQIINNKLYIPVPQEYKFIDVSISLGNNTIFYKLYQVDGDNSLNEVLQEVTVPVTVYILDQNGTGLQNLTVLFKDRVSGREFMSTRSDSTGKATLYVPTGIYDAYVVTSSGDLIYSTTEVEINGATTLTFYTFGTTYAKKITLKLYDAKMRPINPIKIVCVEGDYPQYCKYWGRFYSPKAQNGYYDYLVYLDPNNPQLVVDYSSNKIIYYITDYTEQAIFNNGVYLQVIDTNGNVIKEYFLQATNVDNTFSIILPFVSTEDKEIVIAPTTPIGYEDTERTVVRGFGWIMKTFFEQGMFFVLVAIFVGWGLGAELGSAKAGLGFVIFFLLLFAGTGAIPKVWAGLGAIVIGAILASKISEHLPRGEGET